MQSVPVPAGVAEVRFADIDGDGVDEILLLSRQPVPGQPDEASLTIVKSPASGQPSAQTRALGNRPLFLAPAPEGAGGLWALGASSWQTWSGGQFVPGSAIASPLAQLGRATPTFAEMAKTVFPGAPARLAWSQGAYVCERTGEGGATTSCGSIPAPARGELAPSWNEGGQVLGTTLTPPPLSVTDADGDGIADLLLPDHDTLAVYLSAADAIGARAASWAVPIDLDPPDGPRTKGSTRREIGSVWLDDFDGDHKVDLGVVRYVTNGSFFGATAEWLYARGTGAGFGAVQTVAMPSAAFGATLVDIDGDGHKDLVTGLVDVGMRNLASALVSHVVHADLAVLRYGAGPDGGYGPPVALHSVSFPLDQPQAFHVDFQGDVDGDHHIDLVAAEDGKVNVYRGTVAGMEGTAAYSADLVVPDGDNTLLTHDLDKNGRAEIVVWGKDSGKVWILRE